MGTFRKIVKNHGSSGFLAYLKIKTGFTKNIKLKELAHGITLRPGTSDVTTFKHIFAHGDYNLDITPEPKVIIDAGANVGLAAIYYANRYPQAQIIAIELSPDNYQLLTQNTGKYEQITPVHGGLWPKHELLKFKQEGVSHWGYRVDNTLTDASTSVKSITMNDIIEDYQLKIIDLLKIDIEGAEVELFSEGYENWLPKVRQIIIEFHDRWRPGSSKKIKELLRSYGLAEVGMVGENTVFINAAIS